MYTIVDLIGKTEQKFNTQLELLSFWKWNIQEDDFRSIHTMTFNELNITGNDKRWAAVSVPKDSLLKIGDHTVAFSYIGYTSKMRLRRYQVLDEFGHPCDIRTWTQAIQKINAETYPSGCAKSTVLDKNQPRFRIDPIEGGHKHRHANKQSEAFTKQKLADLRNKFELNPEDDLLGFTPVRNHAKPRVVDQSFRKWKKSDNKCWKTQSKKKAQWERHLRQDLESRGPSRDEEYDWLIEDCESVLAMDAEIGSDFMEYADWNDDLDSYAYDSPNFCCCLPPRQENDKDEKAMFNVYAYDKDNDVTVLLTSSSIYEKAHFAAMSYASLVKDEVIRNEHGVLSTEGEPFDWVFIEKPSGECIVVTN